MTKSNATSSAPSLNDWLDDPAALLRELDRLECEESLAAFIRRAWHVIEPGQPYVHGWHIDAIAEHLEAITAGQITRLLVNVPPGTMKSLATSVFWPAWEWGPKNRASTRYVAASHAQKLAIRDNLRTRRLIASDWYQERWGDRVVLTKDQNVKEKFENEATGIREAVAAGSITGARGDRVIIDDPLSVEDASSEQIRESVVEWFLEAVPTRLNNPDRSAIIVIMQRLHERDVSGVILARELGYEYLMLPMEFDPARRCSTSIGFKDPRHEEGELLFPARFSRAVVDRDKHVMGAYAVAGQFQQLPAPRKGGLFNIDWIRPYTTAPARETMHIYGASDYAVTSNGGDYTVHVIVGLDPEGRLYLLDLWRGQASSDVWIEAFCDLAIKWKPMDWAEETGQIRAGIGPFLDRRQRERKAWVSRTMFPTRGDKAVRAQSIRGRMALSGLYVPAVAPWRADLISELLSFPAGAHDDQVDALGLAGQLLDRMIDGVVPKKTDNKPRDPYRESNSDREDSFMTL